MSQFESELLTALVVGLCCIPLGYLLNMAASMRSSEMPPEHEELHKQLTKALNDWNKLPLGQKSARIKSLQQELNGHNHKGA
jgi:hypothetical protein